ncbi:MAG: hypothetical protein JEZ08_07770 [Clostridiales bacterium]|nr:hypothetical protein [Clostridiales bacterium]
MKEKKWFISSLVVAACLILITSAFGGSLEKIVLLEDKGASWYYWKLPTKEWLPRMTAWTGYILHQLFLWYGIYKIKNDKENKTEWNKRLLIMNLVFILLHFLQTHIWYDGLAQDVPVFSSQGSVIGMLVLILIMENRRRGIFLGKKVKGFKDIQNFILRYHGYYIAWAITYTFWYHPMVSTSGHLVGFLYMFLLFIQASFAKTKIHGNRTWGFILEIIVLFHGTTVAVGQANNMWPMFGFGFAFIAVFTQIYSLKLKTFYRTGIQVLYLIGALFVFGGELAGKTLQDIHQITWIPIIEYGVVFAIVFLGQSVFGIIKKKSKDNL